MGNMGEALSIAVQTIFGWPGILYAILGTLIGMFVGIMPGLGCASGIALLLAFTFNMSKEMAMVFLLPIAGAATFAGSISAILLNMPGMNVNAATALDGYPLSQQGRAGEAIGASAASSAMGAMFGLLFLIISLPILRPFILLFGPPEIFGLAIMGLLLISAVSEGNTINGVISGGMGMFIGMIGYNSVVGGARFTFGNTLLWDGFSIIPTLIGVFALAESIKLLVKRIPIAKIKGIVKGGALKGVVAVFKNFGLFLRSSFLGTFIGVIPGVGGAVACWIGYAQATKSAKPPKCFGKGDIRGVIGPEAANDAKDGGALIPTLLLGIPGSVTMAMLLGAFLIHGITPGRDMLFKNLHITWIIIIALVFSNILTSLIGVLFVNQFVKLTTIPIDLLVPFPIALSLAGSYIGQGTVLGLFIALAMGLIGYIMQRNNIPRGPLVIGVMLAPIAEKAFHQSLQISRGTYSIFYERPITLVLLIIALLSIFSPIFLPFLRRIIPYKKSNIGKQDNKEEPDKKEDLYESEEDLEKASKRKNIGDFVFSISLLVFSIYMLFIAFGFKKDARIFPVTILTLLIILTTLKILARDYPKLANLIYEGKMKGRKTEDKPKYNKHDEVIGIGFVVGATISIFLFGYMIGAPIFTGLLSLFYGHRKIKFALLFSAAMWGFFYLIFNFVIPVRLYPGLISVFLSSVF